MQINRRLAGLLLHPTSLPGQYGIGDLGPAAYRFLDWMRDAGLAYWQVLPLGPTSYGDSPYQCFSACAGNPLLISPELLADDGLLTPEEIMPPAFPPNRIDYGWVIGWKNELLRKAHARFQEGSFPQLKEHFDAFAKRKDIAAWLDDYALFMACKATCGSDGWNTWEPALRSFKPAAVKQKRKELASEIDFHKFAQFLFFDQWASLRQACTERGIAIIGDAPIYVSYDSADTWANQDLFQLDANGTPINVAGVPPDYFSKTGQLWGNPLYDWARMKHDGYAWWIARLTSIFALVDIVRLDHFRGFMGYYAVPFDAPTAEYGQWVKGPGAHFFESIEQHFGELPIIAEDLGEITTDVTAVREQFGLPGMKIMQFAWVTVSNDPIVPDPNDTFIPHRHEPNMVVYTGTHDNDTSLGWWRNSSTHAERACMQTYLATDGNAAHWDLIRTTLMSVANTAIIPIQDFLGLDSDARMNFPGRADGNWTWRVAEGQLGQDLAHQIECATLLYGRHPNEIKSGGAPLVKHPPY